MTWYYTGYRLKLAESVPGHYVIKPLASWKKSPPQPLSWGGWRQWVKVALKQAESLGKDVACAFLGHLVTTLLLVGWEAPAPASAANKCLATFQTSVWVFNFSSLPPFPRNSPTHRVSRAVSLLALLLFAQCLSCVKQHERNITTGSKHLSCVDKQMKKQRRSRWGAVVCQSCDAHALGRQVGSCWESGDPVSGCEAPKHEKKKINCSRFSIGQPGWWGAGDHVLWGTELVQPGEEVASRQQLPIPMKRLPRRQSLALHSSAWWEYEGRLASVETREVQAFWLWGWPSSRASFPVRLWGLHPWKSSRQDWIKSWAT